MGRLTDLLKGKQQFKPMPDEQKQSTYVKQSDLASQAIGTIPPREQRLSSILKQPQVIEPVNTGTFTSQLQPYIQQGKAINEQKKQQEDFRKQMLEGSQQRLDDLLKQAKAIEESPEPDVRQQTALTEDILATRNRITASQPGFQSGFRESFGLQPTARFGAQQATQERQEASQQAIEQARQQEGFGTGRVIGELGKQAALYATVGAALKGTQLGASLASKLGGGRVGEFAANQVVDLLVDTVIQTPQELARGDQWKDIGMNRLIDIGMNLGIGIGGEYLKSLRKVDTEAFEQAVKQLSPEDANLVRNALEGTQREVVETATDVPLSPSTQAFRQQTPSVFDNVVRETLEDAPRQLSTGVDIPVNRRLSDVLKTQPAKIDVPDQGFRTTIPLDDAARRTQDGLQERGFSRNIRTDEATAPELAENFDADPLFYQRLENATTLEKAQARFDKGYQEALKDFDLTKGELRADNVVLAKLLANEATRLGDVDTARRIIADTATNLTSAGQYSQAARILRESNDPAAIITYIEKELKKLNDQGIKRYGTEKPTLLSNLTGSDKTKGWKKIDLTDADKALIEQLPQQATDAQKQVLFEELYKSISDRIPTTRREKIDAWRRIAMLTNPKTHIRNIVGNGIMAGVKKVSDTLAATGEKLLPKLERTKSITVSPENRAIAEQFWNANKTDLADGSRWEIFGVKSPFSEKQIFDNPALETINNFSKNTLEGEDIFFLKRHFVRDLAGFMEARGLTEPTQEAVEYALRRAQEATFRQQNALADIIAKGKKSRYGFLVEAAVPFSKTPANIAQMGLDYSPAGVLKAVTELATNQPPAKFIETLSKGLTGTGLTALGFYMGMNGNARGKYRSDPEEEALFQRAGILPNSITLPTGSYTIDWAQPAAIPFIMGVSAAEQFKNNPDDSTLDKLMASGIKGASTIFDQTMLQGIADIFGSYDAEGIVENVAELPLNYVSQIFPTVFGQLARTIDPVKRERDYGGVLESFQSQTRSKIPFLTTTEPAKRGLFGEEIKYGEGLQNAVQQFLSPGFIGTAQTDPLTTEVLRLYNVVGKDFLPRAKVRSFSHDKVRYELTSEERSEFQRIMGTYTEQEMLKLIDSFAYQNANDEDKAQMIENINDRGYDLAKQEFLKGRGIYD